MNHLAVSQRTLPDPPLPIDSCSCEQQDPRKGTTNFVARFRFSGQISNHATFLLPKCGFSTYSIPPNWVFRHFPMTTGVCDVARFQKMTEKMESCDIYGVQNVPKQTKPCDHGKENAFQAPLFMHFDAPGLPYR